MLTMCDICEGTVSTNLHVSVQGLVFEGGQISAEVETGRRAPFDGYREIVSE